jgi:fructose-bisphosphate aldolase class I
VDRDFFKDNVPQEMSAAKLLHMRIAMPDLLEETVACMRKGTARHKAEAEDILRAEILKHLDALLTSQHVMLKLTLPSQDDFYAELVHDPRVLKAVALSGGYSRDEACRKLSENTGIIASFSRALTESLAAKQSDAEFDKALSATIEGIYLASKAG